MAPNAEDLDGPVNVMPRHEQGLHDGSTAVAERSNAVTIRTAEPATSARLKEFVGSLWYGRATPA